MLIIFGIVLHFLLSFVSVLPFLSLFLLFNLFLSVRWVSLPFPVFPLRHAAPHRPLLPINPIIPPIPLLAPRPLLPRNSRCRCHYRLGGRFGRLEMYPEQSFVLGIIRWAMIDVLAMFRPETPLLSGTSPVLANSAISPSTVGPRRRAAWPWG